MKSKISIWIMVLVFLLKSLILLPIFLILFKVINMVMFDYAASIVYAISEVLFVATFIVMGLNIRSRNIKERKKASYIKSLNNLITNQTNDNILFSGDIIKGSKNLIKNVSESLDVDRVSIWIYDEKKSKISCDSLYCKKADEYKRGKSFKYEDCEKYFESLKDEILIVNDINKSERKKCVNDLYIKSNNIRSMVDVPILYKSDIIGVICLESSNKRNWMEEEINFIQILSSLYSLAWSIKESDKANKALNDLEDFIDNCVLVSKTDKHGKITYVNKKFTAISGYKPSEVIGRDHELLSSNEHDSDFWDNMYLETTKNKKIWNGIVTNKSKSGGLYYVDTYIKADFDYDGKLKGYSSIRQDITNLKLKELEIVNRMNAINKSNMVIEYDMEGKVIYANRNFRTIMGYNSKEVSKGNHFMFLPTDKENEHNEIWKKVKNGKFVTGQFERVKKDGSTVWLSCTYNPIYNIKGEIFRVMKIATDVTETYKQHQEIENKNTYLEHASKILRHDMHSGINTYIPRGISSLERRIKKEDIERLKLESPLRLLKEGLRHTQKVYKGIYEFTNLVRKDVVLSKTNLDIKYILSDYLSSTSYVSQVILDDNLPKLDVNESLFCTAVDNLIRNGLKYNDSETKWVKIYYEDGNIIIEDNGRGMSQKELDRFSEAYIRKSDQKESGSGLGLNICKAILKEHGYQISAEKIKPNGTKIKINII